MTWKELKERIEQMSPENQKDEVIFLDSYDCLKLVTGLFNSSENVYSDGIDVYSEQYFKGYPDRLELVLKKGNYYFK